MLLLLAMRTDPSSTPKRVTLTRIQEGRPPKHLRGGCHVDADQRFFTVGTRTGSREGKQIIAAENRAGSSEG
jgi:hypothetical protein